MKAEPRMHPFQPTPASGPGEPKTPDGPEDADVLRLQHGDMVRRVAELESQLAAVHASTSWRITQPLRSVVNALRWLLSARPRLIVRQLAMLVRRQVARHGWIGTLRRVPHYLRLGPGRLATLDLRAGAAASSPPTPLPPRLHPELWAAPPEPPQIDTTVSVVIPTLNAGPEFALLLRKLATQTWVARIEIVVVDSGSSDATVDLARAAGAVVVQIAPSEFSHSAARNLGADRASGQYLLFMVQDAYPIGDRWVYGLLRYLLDHAAQGMVAVSCTEYCREDSDIMYECAIATHYRFLGCKTDDRIGQYRADDQESLREMGQLSDVSCLIGRQRFLQYRYRGDFAEDLDLGVRLIRDGHRIAMLASVKVIHSHNRTSYYYLKRTFVDITFLVNVFPDFRLPPCESASGLVGGAVHVARQLSDWVDGLADQRDDEAMNLVTQRWLTRFRQMPIDLTAVPERLQLGDGRVEAFVLQLWEQAGRLVGGAAPDTAASMRAARYFVDDFSMRFEHFNRYATDIYPGVDDHLRREWIGAAGKTYAASLGHTLAGLFLDRRTAASDAGERVWLDTVARQLTAGV